MENFKFYVINLDRSKDRLKLINKYYSNLNRIKAYDGLKINEYDDIVLPSDKGDATDCELATSFSHIKAIKSAYENGEKELFIIEDDIVNTYKHYWNKSLREYINHKPHNCECLTFYNTNYNLQIKNINTYELYVKYNPKHWSAGCYYINRAGLKKIYDHYVKDNKINFLHLTNNRKKKNLSLIADHDLIFTKLNTYHLTEPTFNNANFNSTICDSHDSTRKKNISIIDSYFNKKRLYCNPNRKIYFNII